MAAAGIGLGIGRLLAPLLADPGSGFLGTARAPQLTAVTAPLVIATALSITILATAVPAARAARTSTVQALTETVRAARRSSWLIGVSARLPAALLLGLRIAARRPRRILLIVLSVTITVAAIVAVLTARARFADDADGGHRLSNPATARLDQLLLIITMTEAVNLNEAPSSGIY